MSELHDYVYGLKEKKKVSSVRHSWGGEIRFFCRLTLSRPLHKKTENKNLRENLTRQLITDNIPHQIRKRGTFHSHSFYIYLNDLETIKEINSKYPEYVTEISVSSKKYIDSYDSRPPEAYDIEFIDDPCSIIYHNKKSHSMGFRLTMATSFGINYSSQAKALGNLINEQKENYRTSNQSSLDIMLNRGFIVRNCIMYAVDIEHVLMAKIVAPDLIKRIIKLETLNGQKPSGNTGRKGSN